MIAFRFAPRHAKPAMDSWIKAKVRHAEGVVSDISYDGNYYRYTITLT